MATPTSSVPRAKAALMRLFAADTTLATVKALPGPLNPNDRYPHEWIMLGRRSDGRSASSAQTPRIGNQSRDESYDLYFTIMVAGGGYDTSAKDDRVFELFGAAELAFRADPELTAYNGGSPIGQPFQIQGWDYDLDNFPALEAGVASELIATVNCTARLRAS